MGDYVQTRASVNQTNEIVLKRSHNFENIVSFFFLNVTQNKMLLQSFDGIMKYSFSNLI